MFREGSGFVDSVFGGISLNGEEQHLILFHSVPDPVRNRWDTFDEADVPYRIDFIPEIGVVGKCPRHAMKQVIKALRPDSERGLLHFKEFSFHDGAVHRYQFNS